MAGYSGKCVECKTQGQCCWNCRRCFTCHKREDIPRSCTGRQARKDAVGECAQCLRPRDGQHRLCGRCRLLARRYHQKYQQGRMRPCKLCGRLRVGSPVGADVFDTRLCYACARRIAGLRWLHAVISTSYGPETARFAIDELIEPLTLDEMSPAWFEHSSPATADLITEDDWREDTCRRGAERGRFQQNLSENTRSKSST